MYKVLVLACVLVMALVTGCTSITGMGLVAGSGRLASQDFQLTGFDSVDIDSAFNVHVTRGDGYKVTISMDDNLLQYARVTMEGRTLRIRTDERPIALLSPRIERANITMPELQRVKLNGASQATVDGFGQMEQLVASVDGASRLSGDVHAADIIVNADGTGRVDLTGEAETLNLKGNGTSRIDLSGLSVQKASVELDGASNASINASGRLDYDVDGISSLHYAGTPTIGLARAQGPAAIWNR